MEREQRGREERKGKEKHLERTKKTAEGKTRWSEGEKKRKGKGEKGGVGLSHVHLAQRQLIEMVGDSEWSLYVVGPDHQASLAGPIRAECRPYF